MRSAAARFAKLLLVLMAALTCSPAVRAANCDARVPISEPGSAQLEEQEAQLVRDSADLRKLGRDAEAANILGRAYALRHDASVLARQAMAEAASSQWPAAYEHLRCALSLEHSWFQVADASGKLRRTDLEAFLHNRIEPELGWLEIKTVQSGVAVRVNDQLRGVTPLPGPLPVQPGELEVTFDLPGYRSVARAVRVDRAGRQDLSVQLELKPGLLRVVVIQPGARISIDGKIVGMAPLGAALELAPGSHELVVELQGFVAERRRIGIASGKDAEVHLDLQRDATPPPAPVETRSDRSALWLSIAAGGALVSASSAITWSMASSQTAALELDCSGQTAESCDYVARRSQIEGLDTATNVLLFSGLGIAGAGVTAWLLDRPAAPTAARAVRVDVVATPNYQGASCAASF